MGFKTTYGVFQFKVMNFGLCNALATFACMGMHIFKPLTDKYPEECNYYMDDFSTFIDNTPESIKQHRQINIEFLQICKDNNLYLWPEKCIFK